MVFFGEARWHDAHEEHGAHGDFEPHESPAIMLLPLVVLAGLSIVGGVHQPAVRSHTTEQLAHWLEPVRRRRTSSDDGQAAARASIAIAVAPRRHRRSRTSSTPSTRPSRSSRRSSPRAGTTTRRSAAFMGGPGREAFDGVAWFDANVIDGAVNGVGRLVRGTAATHPQGAERQRAQLRRSDRRRRRAAARLVRGRAGESCDRRSRSSPCWCSCRPSARSLVALAVAIAVPNG